MPEFVEIVASELVLIEAERNLAQKAPAALPAFRQLCELAVGETVDKPSRKELDRAAAIIALKDAPVLAAAIKARVDYLVTLDRRHFANDPQIAVRSRLNVLTPEQMLAILRAESL